MPYSFLSRLLPVWILLLACVVLLADYFSGPALHFPILYLVPIMLAAWYSGLPLALFLALLMPCSRLYFVTIWNEPQSETYLAANTVVRIGVMVLLAVLTERVARQTRLLSRKVEQLTGLLPICAFCKKIRSGNDEWVQIERYISDHSQAEFSHGYCPECMQKHFGPYLKRPGKEGGPGK
jgi:K+-sensing histidine kinase KdpD